MLSSFFSVSCALTKRQIPATVRSFGILKDFTQFLEERKASDAKEESDVLFRDQGLGREYYIDPEANKLVFRDIKMEVTFPKVWKRFMAGFIDFSTCSGGSLSLHYLALSYIGDPLIASAVGGLSFVSFFMLRDLGFKRHRRSYGKKVMGLEILNSDMRHIASKKSLFIRNWYHCLEALTLVSPMLFGIPMMVTFVDWYRIITDPQMRKLGDLFASTVVVEELPNRLVRLQKTMNFEKEARNKE
eukprot:TRINITY_DN68847_c1_g3_i1.p1 TRINITY_DN68847_c1_g3~~TRINITY_DN68847_c1_g3_i1.p1  ORF type:complete len:244 (+),score=49.42 TRINITY_DN68847_c1_g3_i1:312-1043(+)